MFHRRSLSKIKLETNKKLIELRSKSGLMINPRSRIFRAPLIWSGIWSVSIDGRNQANIYSSLFITNLKGFTLTTSAGTLASRASPVFARRRDHCASLFQVPRPSSVFWFVRLIMGWEICRNAGFSQVWGHQTPRDGKAGINLRCVAGMSLLRCCLTQIIARYQYQYEISSYGEAGKSKKLKIHGFAG
jgi:hypothetical protein